MNAQQQALYSELCKFQITPIGVVLSFEARLARENGWDLAQAIAVVNEYRKFLLLMLIADHPVSPSDQVDQAWHLHLVYTESYWTVLCGRIAGRPLHHGPTSGGNEERDKFTDLYLKTKESYRHFFGMEPPEDIWPDPKKRFGEDASFRRINVSRNLVIPRPTFLIRQFLAYVCSAFVGKPNSGIATSKTAGVMAIAPLCFGIVNPFDFQGRQFLIFYVTLFATGLIVAIMFRFFLRKRETLNPAALEKLAINLTIDEIAFLNHGPKGPVNAAIAELGHEDKITADITKQQLKSCVQGQATDPLLHQTILLAAASSKRNSVLEVRKACGSIVVRTASKLKTQGLVESSSSFLIPRVVSAMVMLIVLFIGLYKIYLGLGREKPVGFLFALTILVAISTFVMMRKPRLTIMGEQVLDYLKRAKKSPGSSEMATRSDQKTMTANDVGMSVALFGVAAATPFVNASIVKMLMHDKTRVSRDGASYSSGCSGGDGGGGDSGCGGGCGGCGGD